MFDNRRRDLLGRKIDEIEWCLRFQWIYLKIFELALMNILIPK